MQDQLSLFSQDKPAAEELQRTLAWTLGGQPSAIDELTAIAGRCRSSIEFQELLGCLIRFPQYSVFNSLLLYLQKPEVQRVATAGNWLSRYNRRPKPGARPLVILAPTAPVLFLYDVTDTEGAPLTEPSISPALHSSSARREIFNKTRTNCDLHGICVWMMPGRKPGDEVVVRLTAATRKRFRTAELSPRARYLIILDEQASLTANYRDLVLGLGQIFSGHYGIDAGAWWPERTALATETEEIEARSVVDLVCGRLGLTDAGTVFSTHPPGHTRMMPPFSLDAVIQATGYIEEMGRRQWSTPRKRSRYRSS
jgi:hypothetical protein